jgi:hypothetical protein
VKIETKIFWSVCAKDDYWINYCAEKIIGDDYYFHDILFLAKDRAIEFMKMVLSSYEEEVREPSFRHNSILNIDDSSKIQEEIGPKWTKYENRIAESPSEIIVMSDRVILRRPRELRRGVDIRTKKTVIVEGLEYSRDHEETKWSSWYPAGYYDEIWLNYHSVEQIVVV